MTVLRCSAAIVATLFAAMAFGPAFAGGGFALLVAGAVVVAGGACLALAYTRLGKPARVGLGATTLVLYTFLAVAPGLEVHHGLRRLLTAALPVEAAGPELATVVLLAGLAAIASVEPLLRRRLAPLALIGPVALAALGSAISAPAGAPEGWLAAGFVTSAAILLWLAARPQTRAPARSPLWLRILGVSVTLAVLGGTAAAALTATTLLGGDDPAQARALLPEPVQPRIDTSPLALFPALRTGRRPLSITIATPADLGRVRFATLDSFDGTLWTTGARYRWAGRNLPAAPGTVVEERIEVLRDDGLGWLVSSGRPVHVSTPGLGVDEVTGDLVVPSGQQPPKSFVLRSALPLGVPGDAFAASSTMECAPDIAQWARLASGGAHDLAALRRLEAHLSGMRRDDAQDAPGGHGLFQLRKLRTANSGTAEQFASAFAVLARCQGFDARVVIGLRLNQIRAGEYAATGENVHAWAEVRFGRDTWATFDPTPAAADAANGAEPQPSPTPRPSNEPTPPPFVPPSAAPAVDAAPPSDGERFTPVATFTTAGIVVLSYALLVPLLKGARRLRRKRSGPARQRTCAAWRDTLDRLAEAAVPISAADTSGEVAVNARDRLGSNVFRPLLALSQVYDETVYGPLDRDLAGLAWQHADEVRYALAARLTRLRRFLATLDPRPLLTFSHPSRRK